MDDVTEWYVSEWSAGTYQDNRATRCGISLHRWPNRLQLVADWPRGATGKAIAHELRKLADALEEADDA